MDMMDVAAVSVWIFFHEFLWPRAVKAAPGILILVLTHPAPCESFQSSAFHLFPLTNSAWAL